MGKWGREEVRLTSGDRGGRRKERRRQRERGKERWAGGALSSGYSRGRNLKYTFSTDA